MIIEAILTLILGLFQALLTFIATALPAAPGFWIQIGVAVTTVMGYVGDPIKHFLPLGQLTIAAAGLFTLAIALGVIRLVRRAVSLFTGGGGAIK